jgi:hypothetical protein
MRLAVVLALAVLVAEAVAATRPTAFLNHFFVVVDTATYRALQDSAFVTGAFAPFEKRTTSRNDQTYTGIYWYGRHTYFSLQARRPGAVGTSGLAFGVERPANRRW